MFTDKFSLLKTCAGLCIGGLLIKRLTHKLNRTLRRHAPVSHRAVRLSRALERAKTRFSHREEQAIRLFLRISARQ